MPLVALLLAQAAAQAVWKPYPFGGFSLALPSAPAETKVPNAPATSKFWNALHNDRNALMIGVTTLDQKDLSAPDVVLAGVLAGMLHKQHATLTGQTDVVKNGWPGLEVRWSLGDVSGVSEILLVGTKVFQFGAMGDSKTAIEAPYAKMAASLKLPADAGKGPQTTAGPAFVRFPLGKSGASVEFPASPQSEDAPIGNPPGSNTLHRFSAGYGNRVYVGAYTEIPSEQQAKVMDQSIPELLKKLNDDAARSMNLEGATSSDSRLDGTYALRTVGTVADRAAVRIEAAVRDGKVYSFISVVPKAWKDNSEVKRYFDSVKLN